MTDLADVYAPKQAAYLKKLTDAITENIETTTEQNKKLGRYTFWMFIMTIVITLCTIIQVINVLNTG